MICVDLKLCVCVGGGRRYKDSVRRVKAIEKYKKLLKNIERECNAIKKHRNPIVTIGFTRLEFVNPFTISADCQPSDCTAGGLWADKKTL